MASLTVSTTPVPLNLTAYADRGPTGRVVVVQNLGPGNLFLDAVNTVAPSTGIKIAVGGGYEIADYKGGPIFIVADAASTDVRYAAFG